jgi:hypothetical protein
MKLYVLEWYMIDTYDDPSGLIGVYSSREIADLAFEALGYGAISKCLPNITEVFLDREII